jgi:hypothetical protein
MKKPLIAVAAVVLFAVLAMTVYAADLTGTWSADVQTNAGSGTTTFVLKQDGDKLTGTYSDPYGDSAVTGTVKGSDVTLQFNEQGVNATYAGKVNSTGTKIEGSCDYGGQASGTFTATKK